MNLGLLHMEEKSMKKLLKVVVAAVALLCSGTAFAEGMNTYGKLSIGYDYHIGYFNHTIAGSFNHFAIKPAFGMLFVPEHDNFFLRGLGMEAALDINIGGTEWKDVGALTLVPRANAVWHLLFDRATFSNSRQKFIPHFTTGFEIPIFIPLGEDLGVAAGFAWNLGAGLNLKMTDKLDFVADLSISFYFAFDLSAGLVYRFK